MRGILIIYSLFTLVLGTTARAQRHTITLTGGWKFLRNDADIASPTTSWESITVPHTWNALDGQAGGGPITNENQSVTQAKAAAQERAKNKTPNSDPHTTKGYYQGICWYARNLDIPITDKGKRIFIRFEAASLVARVYINGKLLGEHRGAFTAFVYELTDYVKFGKPNELRVSVDNSYREDMPPQSGDFNLCGGLYRPVHLIVTDQVCISPLDFASPGVYVTTKSVNGNQATVEVKLVLSNGKRFAQPNEPVVASSAIRIETQILDSNRFVAVSQNSTADIGADETQSIEQAINIPNPHLWQGRKDPYLYTVKVKLYRNDSLIDEVDQPMGIRTFAITQKDGFLLNGKPYPVYGVGHHQDMRNKGWALSEDDMRTDLSLILEMGATAVRNAHYPQSAYWHSLADSTGLLMWDEVPVVNETRTTREYWRNVDEQMREMVHQLYNHPSIAWWGIYNEIENLYTPPSASQLTRLRDIAKETDSSRIIVAASDHGDRYYNLIPDQIAFNNYPGWYHGNWPEKEGYAGNLDQFAGFLANRAKEVGKRIGISEYGAGGDIRQHTEGKPVKPNPAHGGSFQPEEWQTYVHEEDWRILKDNPNVWGTFLWAICDFSAANRNEGSTPAINTKGLITHDRKIKKDAFFMYKANWNPEPMVYITSSRSVLRKLSVTDIKIYSNCPEVELKVNGRKVGLMKPDNIRVCLFKDIHLKKGINKIEAVAKGNGDKVTDSCKWTLE